MTTRTPEQLVATLIQAVADDPRKRYYATPEGPYVDRNVEEARQAVLAMMRPAAADAAAAPAVGVSDRGETAIEAARELLLMLHLEVMTGASLVSPAVETLMTELDNTISAWDAAQMEPKGA